MNLLSSHSKATMESGVREHFLVITRSAKTGYKRTKRKRQREADWTAAFKEGVLASPKIRTGDIAYSIKLERKLFKPCFQVRAWKGQEFIQQKLRGLCHGLLHLMYSFSQSVEITGTKLWMARRVYSGGVLAPELSRQTISHGLKEERDCPIFKGNPWDRSSTRTYTYSWGGGDIGLFSFFLITRKTTSNVCIPLFCFGISFRI